MVEIIKESNDDLNKNLFLKELSKVADGVTLQITRISDVFESKRNKKDDYVYIDFIILDDFTGKFILNNDGAVKDETININGEIIAIPFTLNELEFIIPIFRIRRQKTNKFYFTFCSHEASKYIVDYLLNLDNLNHEDKLFDLNLYYWNKYFNNINDELNLGKVGEYNRFRSHMLRKFHASSLYNFNNGLSLSEIDALQGRGKNSTHSSYFMENPQILREKYINSLDALIIF